MHYGCGVYKRATPRLSGSISSLLFFSLILRRSKRLWQVSLSEASGPYHVHGAHWMLCACWCVISLIFHSLPMRAYCLCVALQKVPLWACAIAFSRASPAASQVPFLFFAFILLLFCMLLYFLSFPLLPFHYVIFLQVTFFVYIFIIFLSSLLMSPCLVSVAQSTFLIDLNQIATMLQHSTERSLLLVDGMN